MICLMLSTDTTYESMIKRALQNMNHNVQRVNVADKDKTHKAATFIAEIVN